MTEILLVSENKVRSYSNISSNMQSKFIVSAIREAQLDYELVIGTRLYNKIVSMVEDDTIGDDENSSYKTLLDYSQMYLIYNAVTKICLICSAHFDNFGITQSNDDNLVNLSINDVLKIQDLYQKKAEQYLKRIQMFLWQNYKEYPELTREQVNEFAPNLYSASNTSIFLGGARAKGYPYDIYHLGYDK